MQEDGLELDTLLAQIDAEARRLAEDLSRDKHPLEKVLHGLILIRAGEMMISRELARGVVEAFKAHLRARLARGLPGAEASMDTAKGNDKSGSSR